MPHRSLLRMATGSPTREWRLDVATLHLALLVIFTAFLMGCATEPDDPDATSSSVTSGENGCVGGPVVPELPVIKGAPEYIRRVNYEAWAMDNGVEPDWGIGILTAEKRSGWTMWWVGSTFPLFEVPDGPATSWFVSGTEYDLTGAWKNVLTTAGTRETGYESLDILVVDTAGGSGERPDWYQVRLMPPSNSDDGLRWVNRCLLESLPEQVTFQDWESLFAKADGMFEVSGPLYQEPDSSAEVLFSDLSRYYVYQSRVEGGWMQVEALGPEELCAGEVPTDTLAGWIPWRKADGRYTTFYLTRGC